MDVTHPIGQLRGSFYKNRNVYLAAEEPAIFHCHHYNCYLQAVLLDTRDYLPEIQQVLIDSAQEISYTQFTGFFRQSVSLSIQEKKQVIEDYFRFAGFGKIDLERVQEEGGKIRVSSDHYGVGWKLKFGTSKQPVSFFTTGFLTGAIEAMYGLELGNMTGEQEQCLALGHEQSTFIIKKASQIHKELVTSQKEGVFQEATLSQSSETPIDYQVIRNALIDMPIEGDENTGLIDAFGVLLTRHYANYYCNVSYRFLHLFLDKIGDSGFNIATNLLIEAGRVCAFNTCGGVMQSNEWTALIKPMIRTKEDWVHGMIAVINAFGWGFWEVETLEPGKRIVVKISSGYEANAYLKKYGSSTFPISFLGMGGVAGLMNLIYVLNLPETTPVTLDEALYDSISRKAHFFVPKQLKCRAMGDAYDLIEATLN